MALRNIHTAKKVGYTTDGLAVCEVMRLGNTILENHASIVRCIKTLQDPLGLLTPSYMEAGQVILSSELKKEAYMRLFVAAIRHHDPMGRYRLLAWLQERLAIEGTPPQFLGIECDAALAQAVIAQRQRMTDQLQNVFPDNSFDVHNHLSLSLGFEWDTHLEVFPNVEVVWLDPTTPENDLAPQNYMITRLLY